MSINGISIRGDTEQSPPTLIKLDETAVIPARSEAILKIKLSNSEWKGSHYLVEPSQSFQDKYGIQVASSLGDLTHCYEC